MYRISALLLVSMYAAVLGPAEYGRLEQLLALSLLITPLVSLQVYEAFLSTFQRDRRAGMSTAVMIFACMALVCMTIGACVAALAPAYTPIVAALTIHVVTTTAWQIMRNFLRAIDRLDVTAQSEALQSVLSLSTGAFLLYVLELQLLGVFAAVIFANIGACLYSGYRCLERQLLGRDFISRDAVSSVLNISIRLVPNAALWWGIELSDRIILAYFQGDHAVGIYSAGARVAGLLMSAMLLAYQVWQIPAIAALQRGDHAFFASTLRMYAVGVVLSASVLTAIAQPLTFFLMGEEYASANRFTAILICAACLSAFCYFLGIVYYSAESKVSAIKASSAGLVASIGANIALIPVLGSVAAALAAFLAYALMAAMRYLDARALLGISIRWKRCLLPVSILISQVLSLYYALSPSIITLGCVALVLVLRQELAHEMKAFWGHAIKKEH